VRQQALDRAAVVDNAPGIERLVAADDVEERGLAGAVRADQRADRPGRDAKVDVRHRAQVAEGARNALELEARRLAERGDRARIERRERYACVLRLAGEAVVEHGQEAGEAAAKGDQ